MRIFWHPTGPLMRWEDNALLIEDLNPHIRTTWRLTRGWSGSRSAFGSCARQFVEPQSRSPEWRSLAAAG